MKLSMSSSASQGLKRAIKAAEYRELIIILSACI